MYIWAVLFDSLLQGTERRSAASGIFRRELYPGYQFNFTKAWNNGTVKLCLPLFIGSAVLFAPVECLAKAASEAVIALSRPPFKDSCASRRGFERASKCCKEDGSCKHPDASPQVGRFK